MAEQMSKFKSYVQDQVHHLQSTFSKDNFKRGGEILVQGTSIVGIIGANSFGAGSDKIGTLTITPQSYNILSQNIQPIPKVLTKALEKQQAGIEKARELLQEYDTKQSTQQTEYYQNGNSRRRTNTIDCGPNQHPEADGGCHDNPSGGGIQPFNPSSSKDVPPPSSGKSSEGNINPWAVVGIIAGAVGVLYIVRRVGRGRGTRGGGVARISEEYPQISDAMAESFQQAGFSEEDARKLVNRGSLTPKQYDELRERYGRTTPEGQHIDSRDPDSLYSRLSSEMAEAYQNEDMDRYNSIVRQLEENYPDLEI